jgi:lipopolysaccharide assembly outer membrane protein LptD (OstA)
MKLHICIFNIHRHSKLASLILFLITVLLTQSFSQQTRKINHDADNMEFDKNLASGAYRLLGNVVFRHEGAIMYCDSAYFYSATNSLDAFNNVHVIQGDSLHLYGNFLHYDGNTRKANVRKNVRLVSNETNLYTEALDFDLKSNVGYYTTGADIVNGRNELTSREGYYYSNRKMYFFKDTVVVKNPDYTIYSDTLKYNTTSNIAFFLGPTEIISDSNYIYCEDGWYNTETNISFLKDNACLQNPKQTIKGDSLYYERESGYGEAFHNVELVDTEQKIILKGNFATYNQSAEDAMITDKAELIQITDTDSIYIHADTLTSEIDTSGYKIVKGFYRVKMFKSNLQGKCDSMSYSFSDSIIRLYDEPVLWSDENQLTSEYIEIRTRNNKIDELHLIKLAFIISQEDTTKFNQIKGKDMVCYFKNNELYRVNVNGNGQTVYYPKDKNEIIGVNKAESSDLVIFLKDNEVKEIIFYTKPDAVLYPLDKAPQNELKLKDFVWLEKYRPARKEEIF